MNIGLCVVTTLKYKQFFPQLLEGVRRYFLLNHKITVFLFTDEFIGCIVDDRVKVEQHPILSYKFPFATLYRYKIIGRQERRLSEMDFIMYLDVDMGIVSEVTDEILVDGLMAVRHPGFFINNGWGDSINPVTSQSFLAKEDRKHYYCGGTQGGDSFSFLLACRTMAEAIDEDERIGVKAEHNDETHWNHYLHITKKPITEFTPSYCMPEPERLVNAWGLQDLPKIILALDKDHAKMRE